MNCSVVAVAGPILQHVRQRVKHVVHDEVRRAGAGAAVLSVCQLVPQPEDGDLPAHRAVHRHRPGFRAARVCVEPATKPRRVEVHRSDCGKRAGALGPGADAVGVRVEALRVVTCGVDE